mmetsp:Transcript_33090/g.60410  ORF Transcript_33090/g.60410 Transcript_33090/m.60410 type:complete len:101 (-) Transcript_33090:433-735(-)
MFVTYIIMTHNKMMLVYINGRMEFLTPRLDTSLVPSDWYKSIFYLSYMGEDELVLELFISTFCLNKILRLVEKDIVEPSFNESITRLHLPDDTFVANDQF